MRLNELALLRYVTGFGLLLTAFVVLIAALAPKQLVFSQDPDQPEPIELSDIPPIPIAVKAEEVPSLSAASVLVIDPKSGTVLYEKEADTPRYPASTTKIMTALVAIETYLLDELVTVNNAEESVGHTADLSYGETLTVKDLLAAMMIPSGNDAAVALAQHHPLGYQHFLKLMNLKAKQLNLHNTHYSNVSGIEAVDHFMSARDLATLTKTAMDNAVFRSIVGTKRMTITSQDGAQVHELVNLNELLGRVEGVIGVKTGWTNQAGECLVTYTTRDNHDVIVVVMGSEDRFGESERLIEWVFASHQWLEMDELTSLVKARE